MFWTPHAKAKEAGKAVALDGISMQRAKYDTTHRCTRQRTAATESQRIVSVY